MSSELGITPLSKRGFEPRSVGNVNFVRRVEPEAEAKGAPVATVAAWRHEELEPGSVGPDRLERDVEDADGAGLSLAPRMRTASEYLVSSAAVEL